MEMTSINVQPCKVASSERHNQRLKSLDYVRTDLSSKNESLILSDRSLIDELNQIKDAYKKAKGKNLQKKATPIREGVIVIKEDTTMAELIIFAKKCEEKWGLIPLQIYTHKDEGHYNDEGEWNPNLHAHIVWRWCDEIGVTRKLRKQDMAEMQTILAECLQMKRGVSSDKKHLKSMQYKNEAEAQRLKELEEKSYQAEQDLKEADAMKQLIEKVEIPTMRKEAEEKIEKAKQKADEEIAENKEKAEAALKKAIKDLEKEKADAEQSLKDVNEKITAKGEEIEAKNAELQTALGDLKKAREDKTTTEGEITELEQNKAEIEGDITKAKDKLKELDDNKDSLLVEIENLKGKEKELMKEGLSAFGWVAKRFIGIKDEKQQQAMEELYNLKNEIMSETERNLVSADKLIRAKSNNLPSKDKTILEIVRDFVPIEPAIRRVVEIAESALEWGITNVEHIKYLISGGDLTLRSGSQIQGVEIDDDVRVAAVRTKEDRYSVRAIFDNLQLTIKEFVSKIKQKQEEKKRAMVEAKAKRIIESAAPQKPTPRFYGQKPSELQKKVDELGAPTPKKINVPKKGESKKRGRGL